MSEAAQATKRYSISEAAKLLDRSPHTLRSWDRNGSMPKRLRPKRDSNGNRYWTPELIDEIKAWIVDNGFHPGRGIDYHPSEAQLQAHIERIRRSTRAKTNGHDDPQGDEFRRMVVEAISDMGVTQEHIVEMLPKAIQQYDGLGLERALKIVSDVFTTQ